MKKTVIGILAHVDAGKTTLSEAMLYTAGSIRKLGRVDHKDVFLDNFGMEKERGITIFSKQAVFSWNDVNITLLDTPGHVDFSAEMERTLQVLDYAILVISGTDGVQSHTETLWRLLKRYDIPVFIFVNKMDLDGSDKDKIISDIKSKLSSDCVDFTDTESEAFFENAAMCDESVLDKYMDEGILSEDDISGLIMDRKVFPCIFGSALKMQGIELFMDKFTQFIREKSYPEEFGAKVFKIARDNQSKRLTYMKITGGCLKVKSLIEEIDEKADQIRIYSGEKFKTVDEVYAGDICAVTGLLNTHPGEGLGIESESQMPLLEPVMTYKVIVHDKCDMPNLLKDMKQLEEEDPQLHIVWNEQYQEINVQLMGEVQTEVLKSLVWERFHVEIEFGNGNIVYKETIKNTVEGIGHFEPLRHYAEVHLILEPGEPDSGLQFVTKCKEDELDKNWQRLILTHLEEREHPGVLTGSAITDMKITLAAGKAHLKHTEGGDFRQATYRAVRQGLMQAESVLLEPYYDFVIEVPSENIGRTMSDIQRMKGECEAPETMGSSTVLKGIAPVAMMNGYMSEINAYTGGKGRMSCSLMGYRPCSSQEEIVESIGYNPDNDINNPTGSVFCAHGAGFYVPWDEVRKYMHIDAKLTADKDEVQEEEFKTARIMGGTFNGAYSGSIEEDKELERIFERTFGVSANKGKGSDTSGRLGYECRKKWKKKLDYDIVRKARDEYNKTHIKNNGDSKEYLLVDGYNIIFSWKELKELSDINLDAARVRLMDILCNYQGFRQCTLILVFDAYKVKDNPGEVIKYHNINVVYTKEAETADMYIEKVTHELGKKHNVTVATSDGLEQLIVIGQGARRISAREFEEEVNNVSKLIEQIISDDM